MWKWILIGLGIVIVLLFGMCYFVIKKVTSAGPSVTVAIAGTPDRVFASLADGDSLAVWLAAGGTNGGTHGMLKVGDSLRLDGSPDKPGRGGRMTWIVSAIDPSRMLVLEMRDDSLGRVVMARRDSLWAVGDSTYLMSTFGAPMLDSLRSSRADSGKGGSVLLDLSQKLMVGALRLEWESELQRLKARIEGRPLPGDKPAAAPKP